MKPSEFLKKYKHVWTLLYFFLYMPWFVWLEKTVTTDFHLISMPLDYRIPFCEYFIVPYFLWFLFVPAVVGYEFFYSKEEYYRCFGYLCIGMTTFLIICTVWPNGLDLRQDISYRDNLFAALVRTLYKTDTSTNVFPSLHVYNTLVCLIAFHKSKGTKGRRGLKTAVTVVGCLIIASTVFLKQHSLWDVIGAFAMALLYYPVAYRIPWGRRRKLLGL